MKILGIRIDNFSKKEILEKIESFLDEERPGRFHQIATVNPEFVLTAQRDEKFKNILNNCELSVADGIGIWYAFIRHSKLLKARIAGADLLHEILYNAYKHNLKVFIAADTNGLSNFSEIKEALEREYPTVEFEGQNIDSKNEPTWKIEMTPCDIMLCNFGAPMQEKFLNLQKNGTIRLAMGVGGSFDFLTGKVKRAPKVMRFLGLEWLFRLIQEPKYRVRRIINAVIIFPFKIILKK